MITGNQHKIGGRPVTGTPLAVLCPLVEWAHTTWVIVDLVGLVGLMPLGAPYPSKSGLMNKHIVKHKHIVTKKRKAVASYLGFGTFCGSCRFNASFGVPRARLSLDS